MKVTPLKFLGVFRAGIIIIIYLIPVTNIPCFMWFLLYLAATLAVELMFAHARPQNLLTGDSIQPRSAAPEVDDASSLWISDDLKSVSPDLSANPSVQELDTANDLDIFRTSDDLFGSDSTDLSALPACENTSSLTDNVLRARGSCDSGYKPPLNLPNKLFQDSELFLQQNIRTAPAGQMQQPARPDEKVYDSWPTIWTGKNEPDETICPTRVFGSSKIPVCSNGITGRVIPLVNTLAQNLENILPCMCFIRQFICALNCEAIFDKSSS